LDMFFEPRFEPAGYLYAGIAVLRKCGDRCRNTSWTL
jgi:hypothetical protein